MLCIKHSGTDPALNLAIEEHIFKSRREGDILLLWRNAPSIIFGKFQNPYLEADVLHAEKQGIGLYRRMTGGGAVYHDEGNLNYTIMSDRKAIGADYDGFLRPVIAALNSIGVKAYRGDTSEIMLAGKKISGSAQTMDKERVLHHGTLLYDVDLKVLRGILGKREGMVSKGIASNPMEVTNIRESRDFGSIEGFADAFAGALADSFDELSADELAAAAEIKNYSTWEWNFGRTPAFEVDRTVKAGEGELTLRYSAKKGIVEQAEIYLNGEPVKADALIGMPIKRGEAEKRIAALGIGERFSKELLKIFF